MYRESGAGWASGKTGALGESRTPGGCSGGCGVDGPCALNTAHELAESMGLAVDARDRRLFRHSAIVAELSGMLALAHGLTRRQAELVHLAGHLHDVGKIGVPDAILLKPGPLTADEWKVMRRHPEQGAAILRPVRVFCGRPGVCEMVLAHHERFDGDGYPFGLRGRDIPLGARLVAVADALSAMTEDRPYRRGMGLDQALGEIEAGAGRAFDPEVVRDLIPLRPRLERLLALEAAPPA